MQPSSPPPAGDANPVAAPHPHVNPAAALAAAPPPAAGLSILPAVTLPAPTLAALAPHRYDIRVGPTPLSQPHPRPSRRARPSKRARTSGPRESSSLRPQEPHSPPVQGPTGDFPLDLSPASIVRRPIFHCGPIT